MKKAKLVKNLRTLVINANNLLRLELYDAPTTEQLDDMENAAVALIEDMDRVARLIDPEHTHYESN